MARSISCFLTQGLNTELSFIVSDLEHIVKAAGGWSLLSSIMLDILLAFQLSILPGWCGLLFLSH